MHIKMIDCASADFVVWNHVILKNCSVRLSTTQIGSGCYKLSLNNEKRGHQFFA